MTQSKKLSERIFSLITTLSLSTLLLVTAACNIGSRKTAESLFMVKSAELGYDFKHPDAKYLLPYVLEEVSGLDYIEPNTIVCVQDEEAKVYFYNHKERKITKTLRFGSSGDYEGLEVVDQDVYVLKSNGNLYKFERDTEGEIAKSIEIKTFLNKENDLEGLVYNENTSELILACKGSGDANNRPVKGRAFYSFDLNTQSLNTDPVFNITRTNIKSFLEKHVDFEYDQKRINFRPSGIALHPTQHLYYIIASTGKLLLVVNLSGDIQASVPLDPRLLGQPEGICFAENGDMFISSEGQGDKGYILKFAFER